MSSDKIDPSQADEYRSSSSFHASTADFESDASDGFEVSDTGVSIGDSIDRYRILKVLGQGGFGVVYLAEDTSLKRSVAIKISRNRSFASDHDPYTLVDEARAVASLDHPNIVRVYDVNFWGHQPYVVMEYIAGKPLSDWINRNVRIELSLVLSVVRQIGCALEHLHSKGIVHRDLKPANILVLDSGSVKVTDLGLALSDDSPWWKRKQVAGTKRYMSPEQVLGEAHRIDGRTDIWALGIVLYEMLTGTNPFRAEKVDDVFRSILKGDVTPPRQRRPEIPQSVELFCLKCLSKRMSSRFQSASEVLKALAEIDHEFHGLTSERLPSADVRDAMPELTDESPLTAADSQSTKSQTRSQSHTSYGLRGVIPRGLKSFTVADKQYYSRLMPGPYDIHGRPAYLQFWIDWSCEKSIANSIGIVYGKSGCGKSSFVRAALIPSLPDHIAPYYFDFTVKDSTRNLLNELREEFPEASDEVDLPGVFMSIRKSQSTTKTLLIFDQFEQYLQSRNLDFEHEFVQALRQCDGKKLQAILLIRDEYWSDASQLMQLLETKLIDGGNSLNLPMLEISQAKRVLEAFARAHEAFSLEAELSKEQEALIDWIARELATDNQVLCVRIAMFTELMRHYTWDTKTILSLGGVNGILAKFLDDVFYSAGASISARSVAPFAREVLRNLLPDDESDIKSTARTIDELASLTNLPDSGALLQRTLSVLDSDLKLIERRPVHGVDHYSLAHDYLVRPIRDWLKHRDLNTWQGRARQRLHQAAKRYEREPISNHLLSWKEVITVEFGVPKSQRGEIHRSLMRASWWRAAGGWLAVSCLICALAAAGSYALRQRSKAIAQQKTLVVSEVDSFLSAPSRNLERIWERLLRNHDMVVEQLSALDANLTSHAENRRLLLMCILDLPVTSREFVENLRLSDPNETQLWLKQASKPSFREMLYRDLTKNIEAGDSFVSSEAIWVFLLNEDYRLLDLLFRENGKGIEESITAICLAAKRDDVVRVAKNVFRVKVPEGQKTRVKTFALRLISTVENIKEAIDEEMVQFAKAEASNASSSIAMPCQYLLTQIYNRSWIENPRVQGDWLVNRTVSEAPFVMIELPSGTLEFSSSERIGEQDFRVKKVEIPIPSGTWLAREEMNSLVVKKFYQSRNPSREKDDEDAGEWPARDIPKSEVFELCNWLSDLEKLKRCYRVKGSDQGDAMGWMPFSNFDEYEWNSEADGYRIPMHSEIQFAAVSGDVSHFWESVATYPAYRQRYSGFIADNVFAPTWRYPQNYAGFVDLFGNTIDIMRDRNGALSTTRPGLVSKTDWGEGIPISLDSFRFVGFRVARSARKP